MKSLKTWTGQAQALGLAAVAVALVTVGTSARQAEPRRGPGMRGPMPFAHLNLTDDQQARIKGIFEEQREAGEAGREELRKAHDELRNAIFGSATPDTGRVEALVTRIAELDADALRARVATEVKVAAILTPEQRQQMAAARPRGRGPGGPVR